ncbi:hypothetical protein ACKU4M_015175 [Klebsiella pneumoniae]
MGEISVKTGNNARNGGKNSLNRLIRLFAGKKSAQIREILISESAWEEMTCLFAPSLSYCGDPLRSWGNRQLECRINALAPSYTLVKFGYIYFGFNDEGVYEVTPEFAAIFDTASGYIN